VQKGLFGEKGVACVLDCVLPLAVAPKRSCPKKEQHKTQHRPLSDCSDCDEPRLCDDACGREGRSSTCVLLFAGKVQGDGDCNVYIGYEGPFQEWLLDTYMNIVIIWTHSHYRHHQISP
jgi:hypothetical protein